MATVIINGSQAVLREAPQVSRVNRKPAHPFYLKTQAFQIQPFFLAPVLPGETVENINMQARCVSQPVKNQLMGWWKEYYFFYVKLRDLDARDNITRMMLEPDYVLNDGVENGEQLKFNLRGDLNNAHVNWYRMCLKRVVEEYFRDEGEAWDNHMLEGLPLAKINMNTWLDSAKLESELNAVPLDEELPGEYPAVVPDSVPPGFESHYTQWTHMRALNLTAATFEDYLKSYGVRVPTVAREESHVPELIRYVRDWAYPIRDGVGGHQMSWAMAERADKARFCSEPGFIFGVTVARPKVYLDFVYDPLSAYMRTAYDWLPAVLSNDSYTSLKKFNAETGPLTKLGGYGPDGAYWVDLKDLFLHGEPYTNGWPSTFGANYVTRNKDTVSDWQYATEADITALWANPGGKTLEEDGVVNLVVQGRLHETT